ncbi:hypothetical protein M3665_24580, partial [Bacillus licheniformis]|nr:hypothetical protein [Bacillus licheniformis]
MRIVDHRRANRLWWLRRGRRRSLLLRRAARWRVRQAQTRLPCNMRRMRHAVPHRMRSRAARAADTPATTPESNSAQAVGMTAAEFTQWLAATRDTSRSAVGGTDLSVGLPNHTRLI